MRVRKKEKGEGDTSVGVRVGAEVQVMIVSPRRRRRDGARVEAEAGVGRGMSVGVRVRMGAKGDTCREVLREVLNQRCRLKWKGSREMYSLKHAILDLNFLARERNSREINFALLPPLLDMPPSTASSSLHTTSHPASSSSDYLLLTTDSTPLLSSTSSIAIPLPPPRFRPLLQLAAVLDLSFTLIYGVTQLELSKLPASAISLNLARPIIVLWAVSTVRVREMAPVLLGQVIVSISPFSNL